MPLRIDNRKLDMFDGLRRYELLTTEQIALLDGGSKQWMRRILQALELAGHIRRPYGQRKTFKDKRNSWIYGLGNLGADELAEKRGIPRGKLDWNKKNREVNGNYKHKVLLNELRVRLEVDTRDNRHISYIEEPALLKHLGVTSKTWQVPVWENGRVIEVGVTTDFFFRLDIWKTIPATLAISKAAALVALVAVVVGGAIWGYLGKSGTEPGTDLSQMAEQAPEGAYEPYGAVGEPAAPGTSVAEGTTTAPAIAAPEMAPSAAPPPTVGEPVATPTPEQIAPSASETSAATETLAVTEPVTKAAVPEPTSTAAGSETITVKPGEYLYSIAKRVYGDASKWRLIYDANRDQLSNPDAVRVGMKLVVPAAN